MTYRHWMPFVVTLATPFALSADEQDKEFLKEAISADLAEIQLGRLAQEKGQSQEVRDFGRTLVTDHEDALEDARDAAEDEGVTPPQQPSAEAQRDYQRLSQLSGAEFDREFARHMAMDHQKDIAKFEKQASRETAGDDSEATEHAKDTLPALEKHLKIAQSIESDTVRR